MTLVVLSKVQRGRTTVLSEQDKSHRQIARTLGATQGVVSKTYASFLELGTLKNSLRSRGRVATERQNIFYPKQQE